MSTHPTGCLASSKSDSKTYTTKTVLERISLLQSGGNPTGKRRHATNRCQDLICQTNIGRVLFTNFKSYFLLLRIRNFFVALLGFFWFDVLLSICTGIPIWCRTYILRFDISLYSLDYIWWVQLLILIRCGRIMSVSCSYHIPNTSNIVVRWLTKACAGLGKVQIQPLLPVDVVMCGKDMCSFLATFLPLRLQCCVFFHKVARTSAWSESRPLPPPPQVHNLPSADWSHFNIFMWLELCFKTLFIRHHGGRRGASKHHPYESQSRARLFEISTTHG